MSANRKYSTVEELYKGTRKLIRAMISRDYTNDPEDINDISQDLAENMLKIADRLLEMNEDHLHRYLRKMVQSATIDYFEEKAKIKLPTEGDEKMMLEVPSETSVEDEALSYADIDIVDKIGERLSPEEKELVILRYRDDLSYGEIGKAIGISEGNARVRMHRLLEKLKKLTRE